LAAVVHHEMSLILKSTSSQWVLQIALDVPVSVSNTGVFDYAPCEVEWSSPDDWLGRAVLVSFGRQQVVGWVVGHAAQTDVPADKLKAISAVLAFVPRADGMWLQLIRFMARYYQRGLGEVALPALPTALRTASQFQQVDGQINLGVGKQAWKKWQAMCAVPAQLNLSAGLSLSDEQQAVLAQLTQAAQAPRQWPQLLFGITGSGKTEIYLQYLAGILANHPDAQVLVLVPEINLTPQFYARLTARFGDDAVVSLHSKLTESTRLVNFWRASSGHARVILGTRLSILTQLPNLAAIVVDEEHDSSYRQQEGVRYSARDVAIYRAHQLNIPIILGSATPSLETWHAAQTGKYGLHTLRQRAVSGAKPPTVQLVDTNKTTMMDGLSTPLRHVIDKTLAAGKTSLLFQNRRGYAPVLYCGHCGAVNDCTACSAHMVYHQTTRLLHCHHCGTQKRVPKACASCGNADLLPVGQGTQRLEETVQNDWKAARVRRIDADITRKKGQLETQLADIAAGEVDIIIGTQMLAKGHDWPNLTAVGVLDVDGGLFAQDYRAPERLFAQLQQVIGRAGRGQHAGHVIIQTTFPEHPLWRHILAHDYESFAADELAVRAQLGLPPFAAHALLQVAAPRIKNALEFANAARTAALNIIGEHGFDTLTINAAVPMQMMRKNAQERAQLLIESPQRSKLQAFLPHWQAALTQLKSRLTWFVEVDPAEI
jgi:primosomal protein N' (replication factor Y)